MRKVRNEKIVEKSAPASTLMTDLKFGISFIVVGLLIWLVIRYVAEAGNYANKGNVISIANWIFVLFAVIGIFLIGYGAAEYSYARRRSTRR
jgi:heme/copper-type cytochrome/quinol oxidase subunit 2